MGPALATASLESAFEAAKAAWPGVVVDARRFTEYVGARLPHGEELTNALASVHFDGLYLACACADGTPGALAAFETLFADC